ncbi:MAG: glycosyltransferase 87 family protein [Candidatus Diapherotrites archaeon]
MNSRNIQIIIIFAVIALRLVPAILGFGYISDWNSIQNQGNDVWNDLQNYYTEEKFYNIYPPLYLAMPLFAQFMSEFALQDYILWWKIPLIITDALLALLIFKIARKMKFSQKKSFIAAMIFAFIPFSVITTGFYAQVDSVPLLLSLTAFYWFEFKEDKLLIPGLALGAAIAFKLFPIILLPLFLMKIASGNKERIKFAAVSLAPMVLLFLPFLYWNFFGVINNVFLTSSSVPDFGYGGIVSAIWYLFASGKFKAPEIVVAVGKLFFFASLFALYFFRGKKDTLINLIIMAFLCFYVFSPGISAQHLLWVVPFALLTNDKMFKFHAILGSVAVISFLISIHDTVFAGPNREFLGLIQLMNDPARIIFVVFNVLWWASMILWLYIKLRPKSRISSSINNRPFEPGSN